MSGSIPYNVWKHMQHPTNIGFFYIDYNQEVQREIIFIPDSKQTGLLFFEATSLGMQIIAYALLHEERKTIYLMPNMYMQCFPEHDPLPKGANGHKYRSFKKEFFDFEKMILVNYSKRLFGKDWRVVFNTQPRHFKSVSESIERKLKATCFHQDIQDELKKHLLPTWLKPFTTWQTSYQLYKSHNIDNNNIGYFYNQLYRENRIREDLERDVPSLLPLLRLC